jgi:hypothetical protein
LYTGEKTPKNDLFTRKRAFDASAEPGTNKSESATLRATKPGTARLDFA